MDASNKNDENISYFKEIFVDNYKRILDRLSAMMEDSKHGESASMLGVCVNLIVPKITAYMFDKTQGKLIEVVQNYTEEDAKKMYGVFIIWSAVDLINLDLDDETNESIKTVVDNIIDINMESYWPLLKHEKSQTDKLWRVIADVLSMDKDHPEALLNFRVAYTSIANEAFSRISNEL